MLNHTLYRSICFSNRTISLAITTTGQHNHAQHPRHRRKCKHRPRLFIYWRSLGRLYDGHAGHKTRGKSSAVIKFHHDVVRGIFGRNRKPILSWACDFEWNRSSVYGRRNVSLRGRWVTQQSFCKSDSIGAKS